VRVEMEKPELFFKIYSQAAWDKNAAMMVDLYSTDVMIFDMWDKGFYRGIDDTRKNILEWFENLGTDKVEVRFEDIHIKEDSEIAVGYGFIKFAGISKDGVVLRSMKNRITLAFSKNEKQWKVFHQHISLPINAHDLKANFDI
jgi:ketosteroid isomerase-like protein